MIKLYPTYTLQKSRVFTSIVHHVDGTPTSLHPKKQHPIHYARFHLATISTHINYDNCMAMSAGDEGALLLNGQTTGEGGASVEPTIKCNQFGKQRGEPGVDTGRK